ADGALLLQVLADLVVDDLRLVLGGDAGDETLLLRLGDAEAVVGLLDVLGQVLPGGGLLLRGADEVLDVVEGDAGQIRAPGGQRLLVEELQRLEAALEHPLGLVLAGRDVAHDLLGQTAARAGPGGVLVVPAIGVLAHGVDDLVLCELLWCARHGVLPSVSGMCVVQTWAPCARVARRWTGAPMMREMARVSASHSSG